MKREIFRNVTVKYIDTRDLVSGLGYQRAFKEKSKKRINEIAKDFKEHLFGTIKVSYRDNKYNVVDGQHRLSALHMITGGEPTYVPCEVHFELDYKDEANLFVNQLGLCPMDAYNALYESGNKEVIELKKTIESCGFILEFDSVKADNKIVAIRKIHRIYKELGKDQFKKYLRVLKSAWDGVYVSLDTAILGGLAIFMNTYKNTINEDNLIKKLKEITPMILKKKSLSDESATGDLRFAKAILNQYNYKTRNKLDYKFNG